MTSHAATVSENVEPAMGSPVSRLSPLAAAVRVPMHWLALGLSLASVGWLTLALMPGTVPAWPSVSLGVAALASSARPGRPIPRGLGAFLALVGILGGAAQIAVYWGIAQALP